MGKLVSFIDTPKKGCWSRVDLDNGEPVWIGVAQTGVLIKRSRIGLFGTVLYEEKNIHKLVAVGQALAAQIESYNTPIEMTNLVLRTFTQVALNSRSAADLCHTIGKVAHPID